MEKDKKTPENTDPLFLQLLTMLQVGAYQQLGMIANPLTNKTEVKIEVARNTIDLIEMLQNKTDGNLNEEEDQILNQLLYDLRMRYVQTCESKEDVSDPEEGEEEVPDEPEITESQSQDEEI
ncbi:DUF1844 domain-containing protein [bacterium]|nr:DUF1844 domain-containing protein [bacterium]